ncbi:MAG: exodeoxyribonuclease VII large subunit [Nannocystaceae bacterium]|nr:exodeoxyribonuclease VII large subunit [Nannocystaceae bacterium]
MAQSQLSFRRPGSGPPGPGEKPPVLSVSQLVKGANRLLELRFPRLCVEGEVSNLRIVASGHAYFTLKDDFANLPITMWRSNVERLKFQMKDGQMLRVHGSLGIFVKSGRFQMYAERTEPAGLGARMQELEALKKTLQEEGLFDESRKRPLPLWPRRIGVVTSAHGAAIHDILKVARRRCPSRILLASAVVQGPDAPRTIVRGIKRLCAHEDVDVIIIGRGGGSVEDLWAFNDERLARAIAACPVPVVSAVGHEVDISVSDMVADVRAATPSHAAELVVPDRGSFQQRLETMERRMARAVERAALDVRSRLDGDKGRLLAHGQRLVSPARARMRALERRLANVHPRAKAAADAQRIASLRIRLERAGTGLSKGARARFEAGRAELRTCGAGLARDERLRLEAARVRLERGGRAIGERGRLRLAKSAASLHALSPLSVLARGYAVVATGDGAALTSAAGTSVGDVVDVRLSDGSLRARVTAVEPGDDGT